jgi:hypothetical protein
MWPLSSRVRRRNQACSLGFVAPRSGSAFRGANVRAAVRLPSRREMPVCYFTAFLLHHRFRAARSAGMGIVGWQAATKFAGCQFGPCGIRRERQPNNSLKRTVQSLRDWSCRLARSLGVAIRHVQSGSWLPASGRAYGLQTSALRCGCPVGAKCRSVTSRRSCCIIAFAPPGLPAWASSVRRQQPISRAVSSGHAASGVSDSLTTRSSGQSNRFAIGAAA